MSAMPDESTRSTAEDAFLDAAERLLIEVGYANISTRRLGKEAGANHGLIHYYFGSMDELFLQVLQRFTQRLVARQRAMYGEDAPFIEKWRKAMAFFESDLAAGYPKILLELNALAWNKPELQVPLQEVNAQWRAVLMDAFQMAQAEYGLDEEDFPVRAMVSLVMTFHLGMYVERLSDISEWHRELLEWIDDRLVSFERNKAESTA
ncbi:MAG: helix-turn-helix domain-containing protein [Trueperaceae bacterium]